MVRQLAVVLPVLNDAAALPKAVASILEQGQVVVDEIVIAVGPSADTTMQVARELEAQHQAVTVIDNPSGMTPQGMNLGVAHSSGDVIFRVDARSVLPVDYMANALESLETTGAGNIGAVQVATGDSPMQRSVAAAMMSWVGSGGPAYRVGAKLAPVDTAYLGVFRRDAFDSVGGYDERHLRNQDAELNARLNAAGHQVWLDPRLRVTYRPRSSLRGLASQYWQYGWWRQRTGRKNRGSVKLRQLAAPALILGLVASVIAAAIGFVWALLVPVAYLLLILVISLATRGISVIERIGMAIAIVTMHLAWGTSFLVSRVASVLHLHRERADPAP